MKKAKSMVRELDEYYGRRNIVKKSEELKTLDKDKLKDALDWAEELVKTSSYAVAKAKGLV